MKKIYRKDPVCQNCGSMVSDKFCSHCGQANIELHVPVLSFAIHLLGDFFHFDSKFFRTVIPLLFRPGKITLDFLAGRRKTFLDPIRLYIFTSIVFFGLSAYLDHESEALKVKATGADSTLLAESRDTSVHAMSRKDSLKNALMKQVQLDSNDNFATRQFKRKMIERYDKYHGDFGLVLKEIGSKNSAALPKLYFILLPIFALVVKLFYRKRHYVDHAVFALHIHTAIFMLMTIELLLDHFFKEKMIFFIVILYAIAYLLIALRRIYHRSWRYSVFAAMGICCVHGTIFGIAYAAMTMLVFMYL